MGKWEEKTISEVYDVRDGTHDSPKYLKEGYPLVTSKNLKNNNIDLSNVKYISKVDYDSINKRSKVEIGDVLFAMIGTIGNPVLIQEEPNYAIKNVALFKKKDINQDAKFLTYYLGFEKTLEKMTSEAKGATQKFVGLTYLRNFKIPLPPLPEQKRIVAKLDGLFGKIDQAIGLLEENIAHTEALMGSVLDEELSRFETKTAKIKDVLREINSGFACNKSNEIPKGYVHLRTHNIDTSGNLNFDLLVKINPIKVDKKKNQIKKGDILFNNTNSKELVGKTALVDQDYNYGYSNHLTRIRLKEDLISPEFFVNYMINLHSQGYFLQICKKWIGQAGVNTGMLKDISIKFPSIENQVILNKKINSVKENCSALIKEKTQKLNHLKALKNSLLDQAFKGEL